MPNTRELRTRIRSVSNTAKLTNAMQLIAASKLRKAQTMVLNSKEYTKQINRLVHNMVKIGTETPLLEVHNEENSSELLVVFSPSRGLAGQLISNILNTVLKFIDEAQENKKKVKAIAVGKKAERFIAKRPNVELIGSYDFGNYPDHSICNSLSRNIISRYLQGEICKVTLIYSEFVNIGIQKIQKKPLLPISEIDDYNDPNTKVSEYLIEPDNKTILELLSKSYVESIIFSAALDASASEHAARMLAMKSATDNAHELIEDMNLRLNKVRQESITNELLDIIGGTIGVS